MDMENKEFIKHRDILFMTVQEEDDPARIAMDLLQDIEGIGSVDYQNACALSISYNILKITLMDIDDALREVGFHLDNSIISKLKRALFYFTEETQLANLGYDHSESKSTTEIFINRYNQMEHGCRDERPTHLRQYK